MSRLPAAKAKPPKDKPPKEERVSTTDPDAAPLMRMADGAVRPGLERAGGKRLWLRGRD